MVKPGDILLGKFRVEKVLGMGGMGMVVLAYHLHLDQQVAIKFLLPEALDSPPIVARFVREARAAVKLKSEHVCQVHDVGTMENGAPFIVMEYLHGMDLGELGRKRGMLPPGDVVDHMLQACEALAEAHALGMVHRDIKPANLFLTQRSDGSPLVKVLDFGISKTVTPGEKDLTQSKALLGTPAFMAPEQMRSSKQVDARADIWALGAVMYRLLTGRGPFEADALPELCLKIAMDPLPPMGVMLPDGLEAVITRCLQKDPDHRPCNVAELSTSLAPFARSSDQARTSVRRTTGTLGLSEIPEVTQPDGQRASSSPPIAFARAASSPPVHPAVATPPVGSPAILPGLLEQPGPYGQAPFAAMPASPHDPVGAATSGPPSTLRGSVGELTEIVASQRRSKQRPWLIGSAAVLVFAALIGVVVIASERSGTPEIAPAAAPDAPGMTTESTSTPALSSAADVLDAAAAQAASDTPVTARDDLDASIDAGVASASEAVAPGHSGGKTSAAKLPERPVAVKQTSPDSASSPTRSPAARKPDQDTEAVRPKKPSGRKETAARKSRTESDDIFIYTDRKATSGDK